MPSMLQPPHVFKSGATNHSVGTSISLAQNQPLFFQDRNGSRSGLNVSAVIFPRPREAWIIRGLPCDARTTRAPSRRLPVPTGIRASTNAGSRARVENGFNAWGDKLGRFPGRIGGAGVRFSESF